ncbi:MAG TPA: glycosyltransferase family 39 protein [Vicinamibacterales bacterium]|nr:glycosyltransferase family 39 protein [Vicinamibacterales bacterium]
MIRRSLAIAAATAAVWALAVWMTGGFVITLAGIGASSTDPVRPLVAAAVLAFAYTLLSGGPRLGDDLRHLRRLATPSRLAGSLAAAVGVVSLWQGSWTAAGPDAHAYVTRADLLLSGTLKVPVPLAEIAPWPQPLATFVPFGYSPVAGESAIAPALGPGLALLMAPLKAVAGHCAAFWVVPLTSALLVWMTFAIGRRVGSPAIGLGAAWLAATSPALLVMSKEPMSDVPAAAFWALATWDILGGSRWRAARAGLAGGMAILIRPNLVPLAAGLGLWLVWRHRTELRRDGVPRVLAFCSGAVPACLTLAWINNSLFGSPFTSGYGDVSSLFSVANVPVNLARYGRWTTDTHTPLAFAGLVALVVPARRLWPADAARGGPFLLALVTVIVCAFYSVYMPFDAWWYLRFLLPCWPAMCIGSAAIVMTIVERAAPSLVRKGRPSVRWHVAAYAVVMMTLGVHGAVAADRLDVFPAGEGERRYAAIARSGDRRLGRDSDVDPHRASSLLRWPRDYAIRRIGPCLAGSRGGVVCAEGTPPVHPD